MKESCEVHEKHSHTHGPNCGHTSLQHNGHRDYLHDGHLHHVHDGHVDEHMLSGGMNACTPDHKCKDHESGHKHGANCGHEAIPHAGHTDYIVGGHLHHPCETHCDDHGAVSVA